MKTPRARTAKTVKVPANPKLKKLWQTLLAAVHAYEKKGAEDWDREWKTIGKITEHAPPLYTFGGYETDAEFYEKELEIPARVARAYVRVAEHATPADELRFTVWKLDAALGYLEATHAKLPPNTPVDFARLRVHGKKLEDCTVAVLKAATKRARSGKGAKVETAVADSIQASLAKHPGLRDVRVHEASGKVSFYDVPNASLEVFADAVHAAKLGKPSKKASKEPSKKMKKATKKPRK
jgi:hypothetical protein